MPRTEEVTLTITVPKQSLIAILAKIGWELGMRGDEELWMAPGSSAMLTTTEALELELIRQGETSLMGLYTEPRVVFV